MLDGSCGRRMPSDSRPSGLPEDRAGAPGGTVTLEQIDTGPKECFVLH